MTPEGVEISDSFGPVPKKSGALSDAEVSLVLHSLRSLVAQYGGQGKLAVATKNRLRQQVVSRYLATPPQGRPGYAFAQHVAAEMGCSVDELLGRNTATMLPLSAHPEWATAFAQAVAEEPGMAEKIRAVGHIRVPDEVSMTAEFLIGMAHSYSRGKPTPKGPEPRKK